MHIKIQSIDEMEIVKIEREEGQVHFYITGDTHRSFDRIEDFCYEYETTTEWYAGHYHVECEEGGVRFMFEEYDEIMQGEIMENCAFMQKITQRILRSIRLDHM